MDTILVIGPVLKSEGGVTRAIKDYLSFPSPQRKILFNIARPVKTKMKPYKVGYQELINAGIWRMFVAIAVTLWNFIRFPFWLIYYRPRLLYINTVCYSPFWESAVYLLMSRLFFRKSILHYLSSFHIFYSESSPLAKFLIRQVLKLADSIIVLSRQSESLMNSLNLRRPVTYIPSNVDTAEFSTAVPPKFRDLPDKKYVLFIGGADPFRKGILDVFKAIPLVTQKRPDVRFILTGGENVLRYQQINPPEINQHIYFTGWIAESDRLALYKSADILILPSYNEGLPYVIIEAMACGLPIVASRIGGIPEILEDGANGLLIEPGDYQALAQNILRLLNDAELYRTISQANLAKARSSFEKKILHEKIQQLVNNILNSA
ncbi:MAG: glycosyltransferase family 4 protein [Candidatus Sumerlaeia bacterium]|nr:glycosyltransferase family 4 protein [Candidatus Sumerlaeia bacterium]